MYGSAGDQNLVPAVANGDSMCAAAVTASWVDHLASMSPHIRLFMRLKRIVTVRSSFKPHRDLPRLSLLLKK